MTGSFSSFFELRDNPFRSNPDPHYLFFTLQTQKSLEQLIAGIRDRKGLLLVTGEVGTGKTVLLNLLMERLRQEGMPTAFVYNSHLKASDLFDLVLADFGIPFHEQRGTALAHLNSWLQDRFRAGQTPVLFVDEAQGLPRRALEELRMLLNLQTPAGNLLQIVLCGQPEFEEALTRPELRPIRQRVAVRCRTLPLTREETQSYIECRQRIAGASGAPIFHTEAVQALFLYSRGIPRVLNLLCEQALLRASREKVRPVPVQMVGAAAHEFQFDSVRPLGPDSALDGAVLSDRFALGPPLGELPELSSATTPIYCDAQVSASPLSGPDVAQLQRPALFALQEPHRASPPLKVRDANGNWSASDRPQGASTPLVFPSRDDWNSRFGSTLPETSEACGLSAQVGTPTELLLAELSAVPAIVAPLTKAQSPGSKQKIDFHQHWKRHRVTLSDTIQSALSAGTFWARIQLARLRVNSLVFRQFLGRRSRLWLTPIRNLAISFPRPELVSSCLRWLRAPSNSKKARHAELKPYRRHPVAELFGRKPVSQRARIEDWAQADYRNGLFNFERSLRLAASVLHWLQQPAHTTRGRQASPLSQHSHHLT